jgi:hypothetical protein
MKEADKKRVLRWFGIERRLLKCFGDNTLLKNGEKIVANSTGMAEIFNRLGLLLPA